MLWPAVPSGFRLCLLRLASRSPPIVAMLATVCTVQFAGAQIRHDNRSARSTRNARVARSDDVSVHFVVRVPNGVRVDIETVNGELDVSGVNTEVRVETVNGSIEARSAGGPVRAKTVNDSITVGMGNMTTCDDLDYVIVNGAITVEMPSNFGAQLELSTVNGRVNADFPVTVVGILSTHKLRDTVGNGSARVRATTVNGSTSLVKNCSQKAQEPNGGCSRNAEEQTAVGTPKNYVPPESQRTRRRQLFRGLAAVCSSAPSLRP